MATENPEFLRFRQEVTQKGILYRSEAVSLLTQVHLSFERSAQSDADSKLLNGQLTVIDMHLSLDTREYLSREQFIEVADVWKSMPMLDIIKVTAHAKVTKERIEEAHARAREVAERVAQREAEEHVEADRRRKATEVNERAFRAVNATRSTRAEDREQVRARFPGITGSGMRMKLVRLREGKPL